MKTARKESFNIRFDRVFHATTTFFGHVVLLMPIPAAFMVLVIRA